MISELGSLHNRASCPCAILHVIRSNSFTALVVGPTTVMPSEYLPEIWGEDSDPTIYDSVEQAEYMMGLLMRHWNTIASRDGVGQRLSVLQYSRWCQLGISAQEVLGKRCTARRHNDANDPKCPSPVGQTNGIANLTGSDGGCGDDGRPSSGKNKQIEEKSCL